MAIKLNLQNAYDRVSWRFIQAVLLHLGFNQTFTSWIISCISSFSFEVLVNGGKTESFKLGRDLRQGDPLSSYLFILGQEILFGMLDLELRNKNLYGIKTSKSGPTITHVIYADVIVLFSKASRKDVGTISRILEKYSLRFDQLVNKNKFNELSLALVSPSPNYIHAAQPSWILPPPGWLKINVDVALSTTHASLDVVARDHLGVPIKIWARIMKVRQPLLFWLNLRLCSRQYSWLRENDGTMWSLKVMQRLVLML
ncbi:uncharacterized protein LOC112015206 [Quercus suber]|uniref:uncharacterized protein LOC112015206 n=1 Tax=Quercus suber TaxID=58331 RepID=UPI0032DE5973